MITPPAIDNAFALSLAEDETLSALPVFTGQSGSTMPPVSFLLVACGQLSGASPSFVNAEIVFQLDSPALPDDAAALGTHQTQAAALLAFCSDREALAEGFSEITLLGRYVMQTEHRTQEDRWIFEVVVRCGFSL